MTTFSELAAQKDAQIETLGHRLEESLAALDRMQAKQWIPMFNGNWAETEEGPSLDQVKEASKRNREMMALQPHVGAGVELIYSYVWADGIHYEGIPAENRGSGPKVRQLMDMQKNQDEYFSQSARKQRQVAFYCDGIALYSGDDTTKELEQVSISEITDDYRNPDRGSEVWAYRRTWTRYKLDGNSEVKNEWIFKNGFTDKARGRKTLTYNGKAEPIATNKRMFVKRALPVPGWAYGVAEVQRGIQFAEDYRRALGDGMDMNESMATLMGQMKHNTQSGADTAAIQMGNAGPGSFAHTATNQDMTVFATAGKSYDFSSSLPVLAVFAAGIGVSVIDISMNSGNAGGSYGAAKALSPAAQALTKSRRHFNVDLDREVLIWLGAKPDKLDIWFPPLADSAEIYRDTQGVLLMWSSGLYTADEIKAKLEAIQGAQVVAPVPDGVMLPNNEKSLNRADIDADGSTTSAPGQGQSPAFGGGGSGNQGSGDIRNRDVESLATQLRDGQLMLKLEELIERVEAVQRE